MSKLHDKSVFEKGNANWQKVINSVTNKNNITTLSSTKLTPTQPSDRKIILGGKIQKIK